MPDELKKAAKIVCKYCYLKYECWCDACLITKIKKEFNEEENEQ